MSDQSYIMCLAAHKQASDDVKALYSYFNVALIALGLLSWAESHVATDDVLTGCAAILLMMAIVWFIAAIWPLKYKELAPCGVWVESYYEAKQMRDGLIGRMVEAESTNRGLTKRRWRCLKVSLLAMLSALVVIAAQLVMMAWR